MFVVVFIVLVADSGNGFTVGPPPLPSVCKTMSPQHHDYKAQTGESPFTVSIDRKETAGGQSVFVNLATTDPETKYIGFYVQARDENDNPVGVFTPNTDTKVHNCFGKRSNAAHHATGLVKKSNTTIIWTAPRNFQGEIVLTGTMMRDFVTYWVFLQSEPLIVTAADGLEEVVGNTLPLSGSGSSGSSSRPTPRPRPSLNATLFTLIDNIGSIFRFRLTNSSSGTGIGRRCDTDRVFNQWFCNLFSNPNAVGG